MHSHFTRSSLVCLVALATTLLAAVASCASSYYLHVLPAAASLADVSITNIRVSTPPGRQPFRAAQLGMEYALVEFDLKADLRALRHWNVSAWVGEASANHSNR